MSNAIPNKNKKQKKIYLCQVNKKNTKTKVCNYSTLIA